MATYKLLDSYTVGAGGASSVTFSSIPQTYSDLKIVVSARANGSSNWQIGVTQFNTDTTAGNYPSVILYGYNGTRGGQTANQWGGGYVPNSTQTANTFSNTETYITNYAANGVAKTISVHSIAENNAINYAPYQLTSMTWSGTAPITQIVFTPDNGSFTQYSTFYLYGVWADTSTGTPSAPTIGTASAGPAAASVEFTPAGSGNTAVTYTAISTPDSITGTGTSSPISVTGLTPSTSYTFKVAGVNPIGTGTYSAASNSISAGPTTGYFHIASQTISGSSTTSVTFNNIPQFYKSLVLMVRATANTNNDFLFRLNGDSTSNAYYNQQYVSNGGGSGSGGSQDNKVGLFQYVTGWYASGLFNIDGYSFSSGYKNVRGYWGYENNSGTQILYYANALWLNENAVTSLVWTTNNGTYPITANSVFSLYGIV